MPYKPKKPCAFPGCPNLTAGRYCDAHASQANREYNQDRRDPAHKERYGSAWRKIRNLYISKHPLCERCLERGFYTSAEEVHHIKPLDVGGDNSDENLMSLCKSCHSSISDASRPH
jgi:5-methylcytosine-specific restriction protein A